jgi:hypothetical protein
MLLNTTLLLALAAAQPVETQAVPAAPTLAYADLADLALVAPVVAHVRIASVDRLSEEEAPTVRPGHRRFLVEADIAALIRGPSEMPARVRYVIDLANDSNGRPARLRRREELLVLAQIVPNRDGEIRLIAPDAQLPFTPSTADQLRAILREAAQAGAPPRITGIGRAFHVPGSLPGESETQIFLQTADNRPISLNILRRPGERPRWSVALSEIVDDAARPPAPDTLLWYRLACTLPRALPAQSVAEAERSEAQAIAADYRLVLQGLGPCERRRTPR